MNNQEEIIISNEKDAFALIKKALDKTVPDDVKITFDKWPLLTIELEGDGYEGTITPSMMKSLIDFQTGLNRTYMTIVHDEKNLNHLKVSEKQDLEFKAKVENGCTLLTIDLSEYGQKIVTDLISKMEPTHIVLFGVSAMALWVAGSVIKTHMTLASHDKDVSEEAKRAIALSEQETKRMEIMAQVKTIEPRLNSIQQEASTATIGLLKGLSDAQSIELNGIKFNRDDAKSIGQVKRSESKEIQLNGNYFINTVDTSIADEVKIKLYHIDSQREFNAKFKDDSLDKKQISLLQEAEWSRTNPKAKVYLSVNATELRGEITTATIISVTKQS